jgi:hypothetical protein
MFGFECDQGLLKGKVTKIINHFIPLNIILKKLIYKMPYHFFFVTTNFKAKLTKSYIKLIFNKNIR